MMIMTVEELEQKQSEMTNTELIDLSKQEVRKLCITGGKSMTMNVPVRVTDTDLILIELIKRFEKLTT